jgi:hypothetical protein
MNTTLEQCPACSEDRCPDCPRPDLRGRVTAEGTELPTCCCGRRFIRGLSPAEARAEAVRRLRDYEDGRES